MQAGQQAAYVFAWEQVELDGLPGCDPATMQVGATWRWAGRAMRVDSPSDLLVLENSGDTRDRAAQKVRRLLAGHFDGGPAAARPDMAALPANGFDLTDGVTVFRAVILKGAAGGLLVMFQGALPPAETDLWILRQDVRPEPPQARAGTICFLPGTLIETENGLRPVEQILPGDRVLTRDNGPQDVIWRATRAVGGARLLADPGLRPVRIRAGVLSANTPRPDLFLSPDHRVLLRSEAANAIFGTPEILVAARDLVDLPGVSVDNRPRNISYIHLMLEGHQVLHANGVACESFHPAEADLTHLSAAELSALETCLPGIRRDPTRFGEFARRLIDRAEAALLSHGVLQGH